MVNTETKSLNNNMAKFFKALIFSLIIALALILIFAFILKITNISDSIITPINLVIKAISITVGTIIFTKNGVNGFKKGLAVGASFTVLSFIVFSLLNGNFNINLGFFLDILFGALIGAIVGIITVNIKKN